MLVVVFVLCRCYNYGRVSIVPIVVWLCFCGRTLCSASMLSILSLRCSLQRSTASYIDNLLCIKHPALPQADSTSCDMLEMHLAFHAKAFAPAAAHDPTRCQYVRTMAREDRLGPVASSIIAHPSRPNSHRAIITACVMRDTREGRRRRTRQQLHTPPNDIYFCRAAPRGPLVNIFTRLSAGF